VYLCLQFLHVQFRIFFIIIILDEVSCTISVFSHRLYFVSIQIDLVGEKQISSLVQRIKVSSNTFYLSSYMIVMCSYKMNLLVVVCI
jgi:hypothetical protein